MVTAYIGIGSNLGDREAHIRAAVAAVGALPETRVTGRAPVIETAPVGGPSQPDYLNTAIAVETAFEPEALLAALAAVEDALGRTRAERWGPRTVDLDILLYGDRVIETPALTVPHPRMAERLFVLEPLAALAPGAVHPVLLKPIRQLFEECKARCCRQDSGT